MTAFGKAFSSPVPSGRDARTDQLQERLMNYPGVEAASVDELLRQVRNYLRLAIEQEDLVTSRTEMFQMVKKEEDKPNRGEFLIVGGDKNAERDPNLPSLKRPDGGFFHFALTCRPQGRGALELLAYNFELVFPAMPDAEEGALREFVRFDLSSPTGEATKNIDRGLRSHMHPGRDDIQIPAAALTWLELLDLFVYRLKPRDLEKRRAA